jgi:hypothetical protein
MKIHFRTKDRPSIKSIDTSSFDYGCTAPVMIRDMNGPETGDVSEMFEPYTRKANRDLIERSFNGTDFLSRMAARARDIYAEFPERFTCSSVEPLKNKKLQSADAGEVKIVDLIFPLHLIYKQIASSR